VIEVLTTIVSDYFSTLITPIKISPLVVVIFGALMYWAGGIEKKGMGDEDEVV